MTEQSWNRLRAVVEAAFGLDPRSRDAWLIQECGHDPELLAEARSLVEASLGDEGFLEPDPRLTLTVGDRVGPYQLVRLLASGGMGTVYEAERRDPHRRVALKLMRTVIHGPDSAARFRYEVEVLARLQHPGIAAMYESGMHKELPWFAMEYIEDARTLLAHTEALDLRDQVRLFVEVCDAVQHGHANGVLHRDLKPDNILVGRDGRCKVIDFGVARATDSDVEMTTLRTNPGEIVGTLAYMSPEQVEGDPNALDTRSDVYALGVVLYELLAGELPYPVRGAAPLTAMRVIRDTPPRRPGSVAAALRGELETILLKCLAKEKARRYDSAGELGQELRRYLAHEPISAHPPSVTYQLRVFTRRHRAFVAAAIVVVLVSLAAAVISTTYAVRAGHSEKSALRERDRAAELVESLLKHSSATNREFVPRLLRVAGTTPIVLEMTEANLEALASLEELAADDPRTRHEIASAYLSLAALQGDPDSPTHLGDRKSSMATYARALGIARELFDAHPEESRSIFLYARSLGRLGYVKAYVKQHDEAQALLEEAQALFGRYYKRHPDRVEGARAHSVTLRRLALAALGRGDRDANARYMSASHEARREAAERWPASVAVRFDLAQSHADMANVCGRAGDEAGSRRHRDTAIAHFDSLVRDEPDSVIFRLQLVNCLRIAGDLTTDLAKGTARAQRALDLILDLQQRAPENRQIPMSLILAQYTVAHACERQGAAEPEAAARRALQVRARDAYLAIVRHYEKRGNAHGGFVDRARERYEKLRAELGGG